MTSFYTNANFIAILAPVPSPLCDWRHAYVLTAGSYLCGWMELWQEGGMQIWLGLAWLGWDALPLPLHPLPSPQGAVEDQIRMSSQIGISLIVECLRKMDGWIWDWDGPALPQGPAELITYVEGNITNDLISRITTIAAIKQERTL